MQRSGCDCVLLHGPRSTPGGCRKFLLSQSTTSSIDAYQAFHLPNPRKLPLMFLPAKFDSNDGLQRLGLAYMTKAGGSAIPQLPNTTTITNNASTSYKPDSSSTTTSAGAKDPAKKRKRRQSAPAQAGFKEAASRATAGGNGDEVSAGGNGAGRSKKRISLGLAKVEEDSEKP